MTFMQLAGLQALRAPWATCCWRIAHQDSLQRAQDVVLTADAHTVFAWLPADLFNVLCSWHPALPAAKQIGSHRTTQACQPISASLHTPAVVHEETCQRFATATSGCVLAPLIVAQHTTASRACTALVSVRLLQPFCQMRVLSGAARSGHMQDC